MKKDFLANNGGDKKLSTLYDNSSVPQKHTAKTTKRIVMQITDFVFFFFFIEMEVEKAGLYCGTMQMEL